MNTNGNNPISRENELSVNSTSTGNEKANEKDVVVNHAEIVWHEKRIEWIVDASKMSQRICRESVMSWTTTCEDLLLSTEPFFKPVPLAEKVDFLVDIWLDEGLFD